MSVEWISMGATIAISIIGSSALTAYINNRNTNIKEKNAEEKYLVFSHLYFLKLLQEYIGECLACTASNYVDLKDRNFNYRRPDTFHGSPPEPVELLKRVDKDAPVEMSHLVLELDRLHKQSKLDLQYIDDPDNVRFDSNEEAYNYFEKLFSYAAYLALEAVQEIQKKYALKNYLIGVDEKKLKAGHDDFLKIYL